MRMHLNQAYTQKDKAYRLCTNCINRFETTNPSPAFCLEQNSKCLDIDARFCEFYEVKDQSINHNA